MSRRWCRRAAGMALWPGSRHGGGLGQGLSWPRLATQGGGSKTQMFKETDFQIYEVFIRRESVSILHPR